MPKFYPVTRTKIVEVPVGTGDRDVSFPDSLDLGDALAGTLGPVRAPDSIDLNDTFVARDARLQDSLLATDDLGAISGLQLNDSLDFGDALAGLLGPVRAPDSIDLGDSFVARDARLQDSLDVSDAAAVTLAASHADSLAIGDITNAITASASDSLDAADALSQVSAAAGDSLDMADLFASTSANVFDSIDVGDAANATISTTIPDSLDVADQQTIAAMASDSLDAADARQNASITNAYSWANAVVANTNFTNPNNLIDTSTTTSADITATQSGGLVGGSSVTVSGSIEVSLPDPTITPAPTISNAQVECGWTTTASGGLQTGNSVTMAIDYSLDDGGSWTNLANVTTVAGSGDPTAAVSLTLTQLQQARFRAVGNVVSGTTAIIGGATQTFSFRYARIKFDATQSLP